MFRPSYRRYWVDKEFVLCQSILLFGKKRFYFGVETSSKYLPLKKMNIHNTLKTVVLPPHYKTNHCNLEILYFLFHNYPLDIEVSFF
jgi:hypothetical protein